MGAERTHRNMKRRDERLTSTKIHFSGASRINLEVGTKAVVFSTEEREWLHGLGGAFTLEHDGGTLDASDWYRDTEPILCKGSPRPHAANQCISF